MINVNFDQSIKFIAIKFNSVIICYTYIFSLRVATQFHYLNEFIPYILIMLIFILNTYLFSLN